MTTTTIPIAQSCCRVHFRLTRPRGRTITLPCDSRGEVHLDLLSDSAKRDYLFARVMSRRDSIQPEIEYMAAAD
jgi:hypothetical protein